MGLFGRKEKGRHSLGAAVTSIPSAPLHGGRPAVVAAPAAPFFPGTPAAPMPPFFPEAPAAPVAPAPVAAPQAAPAPPVAPAPPAVVVAEPPAPPAGTALMAEIADLIASGEAWSVGPPVQAAPAPPAPPVQAPPVLAGPPMQPPPVQPATAFPTVVMPPPHAARVDVPARTPTAPPTAKPARSSLEAALAELLPLQHESGGLELPPVDAQVHPVGQPTEPSPVVQPTPVEAQPASRVQLGFRDGSSAPLAPDSSQYSALEQLAQSLTRRD